jgi:hypothetical protein
MSIEEIFPKLGGSHYRRTSEPDEKYNCIAWAAGRDDEWWDIAPGYRWPDNVPRHGAVENLVKLYESLGFVCCASNAREEGFEKVAVYGDGYMWTHAARQLDNGKWTSKLGQLEDIEHESLEALSGAVYGSVVQVLKKPTTWQSK